MEQNLKIEQLPNVKGVSEWVRSAIWGYLNIQEQFLPNKTLYIAVTDHFVHCNSGTEELHNSKSTAVSQKTKKAHRCISHCITRWLFSITQCRQLSLQAQTHTHSLCWQGQRKCQTSLAQTRLQRNTKEHCHWDMKGDRKGGGGKGERQSLGEGRCQGSCNELGWQLEEKSSKGARWEKLSWENKQKKVMRRRKRETEQKTSWGWDDKNKTEKKKENRNKKESIKRCYYVEKKLIRSKTNHSLLLKFGLCFRLSSIFFISFHQFRLVAGRLTDLQAFVLPRKEKRNLSHTHGLTIRQRLSGCVNSFKFLPACARHFID